MQKLLASFIFFTRLPFWRVGNVDSALYKRVVDCWPMVGWLTGSVTAVAFLALSTFLLPWAAVTGAFALRALITGALHEDGLADFFDGMGGGGNDRTRILAIMKDSHIGTYGVLGLIFYFLFVTSAVASLPAATGACVIFAGDVWSKFCAAQIINFLPYARKETEAKNRTVYSRMSTGSFLLALIFSLLPSCLLYPRLLPALVAPVAVTALLIPFMKRKIGGYTGDCCGALDLLNELSFYIAACAAYRFI